MACDPTRIAYLSDNYLTVAGSFDNAGTPLTGVTDFVTGATITSATVEATITDVDGNNLTGMSWPLSLPHVGTGVPPANPPDGTYRAVVTDALDSYAGQVVLVVVTIDDGANRRLRKVLTTTVEEAT